MAYNYLTRVLVPSLIVVAIFISGFFTGRQWMKEYVVVRCQAESPRWYPYPQMCKYFVGDIKGRDE